MLSNKKLYTWASAAAVVPFIGVKLKQCYKKIEEDIEISDDAIEMDGEKVFLRELLKKIRIELLHEIEAIENEIESIHAIKIQESLHDKWMNIFHFLSKKMAQ